MSAIILPKNKNWYDENRQTVAGRARDGGDAAAARDHSQGQTATIECENLIQVIFIAGVKESIIFPQRRLLLS